MKTHLLKATYKLINSLPESSVNMSRWVQDCKTIGCAAGHMANDAILRAEGFYLLYENNRYKPALKVVESRERFFGLLKSKISHTHKGYEALAVLLDISEEDAFMLFGPIELHHHSDKEMFLGRMRAYAAKHNFSLEDETYIAEEVTRKAIAKALVTSRNE